MGKKILPMPRVLARLDDEDISVQSIGAKEYPKCETLEEWLAVVTQVFEDNKVPECDRHRWLAAKMGRVGGR